MLVSFIKPSDTLYILKISHALPQPTTCHASHISSFEIFALRAIVKSESTFHKVSEAVIPHLVPQSAKMDTVRTVFSFKRSIGIIHLISHFYELHIMGIG